MWIRYLLPSISAAMSIFVLPVARSQYIPPSDSGSGLLQSITVTGEQIPSNESVLPTTQNSVAPYDLDLNIQDTPRNVTTLSRTELDDIHIHDVRDFSKLTNSSYTNTTYGAPANPAIRGQYTDVLINGIREGLTSDGTGLPIDFNTVDSIDILKGPPGVVYGSSTYVGGYVNYNTKQPYFDRLRGSISTTFGSYDTYRWNIDTGGPLLPKKLAFRFIYSGENSGSYYANILTQVHSFYGALTWIPSGQYSLVFNGSLQFVKYAENFGFNRVTQDLIDHGKYITGFAGSENIYGGSNLFFPTGIITLDRSRHVSNPDDFSYGRKFYGQIIQTLVLKDNASIVNNTFFEYVNRNVKSSNAYSELIDPAIHFENRTELHLDFSTTVGKNTAISKGPDEKNAKASSFFPFIINNKINLGLDIDYKEINAIDNYYAEVLNAWDLSKPLSSIHYINYYGSGAVPIPGRSGMFGAAGDGYTNHSRIFTIAPFYQNILGFGDHFSLLAGIRGDIIWINSQDPLYSATNAASYTYGTERFIGRKGDNTIVLDPNFNVSPTFKLFKWLTIYFTHNYSQSINPGLAGGFALSSSSNGNGTRTLSNIPVGANLHQVSQLFEVGAKANLVDDKLFVNAALFSQERNIKESTGQSLKNRVRGFEIEASYQPNHNFYLTAGYSYLDSSVVGSPQELQQYPVDAPQLRRANGSISTDSFVELPNGHYRQPGLPKHLFNFLTHYQIPTHIGTFGAILGANLFGSYFTGYNGYVTVPWQYQLDLTLFYKTKGERMEARLALINLTDQKNWSPPDPYYGYDSITPDLPFHIEGTIIYRF